MGREVSLAAPAVRKALAEREAGCIIPDCLVPGCLAPASSCQAHHVPVWALGGPTVRDNLALLCPSHHIAAEHGTYTMHPAPSGQHPPSGTRTNGTWWITPQRC